MLDLWLKGKILRQMKIWIQDLSPAMHSLSFIQFTTGLGVCERTFSTLAILSGKSLSLWLQKGPLVFRQGCVSRICLLEESFVEALIWMLCNNAEDFSGSNWMTLFKVALPQVKNVVEICYSSLLGFKSGTTNKQVRWEAKMIHWYLRPYPRNRMTSPPIHRHSMLYSYGIIKINVRDASMISWKRQGCGWKWDIRTIGTQSINQFIFSTVIWDAETILFSNQK